ncbi:MAG TPA: hypothetical protein VH500_08105 [Nitrososphaeraceae archaeon]|jgi:hypothetical protein
MTNEILESSALLYQLDERPFGKTWEEWTTKWWKWFLSMPIDDNPAYDNTGNKAKANQIDPNVWFLAGTTGGTAERTIIIPADKAILLPIINITTSFSENPKLKTEKDLESYVDSHMNNIVKKEAYIDGHTLFISDNHRMRSPLFTFSFPKNNLYRVQEGSTEGIGDGYWLFIKPLAQGMHTVRTFGSCMSGKIRIDVSIKLLVN